MGLLSLKGNGRDLVFLASAPFRLLFFALLVQLGSPQLCGPHSQTVVLA